MLCTVIELFRHNLVGLSIEGSHSKNDLYMFVTVRSLHFVTTSQ